MHDIENHTICYLRDLLVTNAHADPIITTFLTKWNYEEPWHELTTQAGYARLTAKARHPTLAELLRRIMRQEGRHIDFYTTQARKRLARSAAAQRTTRLALRRYWHPVGAGVRPKTEVDFVIAYLFSGPDGQAAAARIDRNIARLPGLGGLGLVAAARG